LLFTNTVYLFSLSLRTDNYVCQVQTQTVGWVGWTEHIQIHAEDIHGQKLHALLHITCKRENSVGSNFVCPASTDICTPEHYTWIRFQSKHDFVKINRCTPEKVKPCNKVLKSCNNTKATASCLMQTCSPPFYLLSYLWDDLSIS
jgi:hypothetical protein